jgi:general secretion pathway protein D
MIPFLGEIPGIGKLFSYSTLEDVSTEMFIFITPKIVEDPSCGFEDIRQQEMHRRPGDIPEFMYCLVEAERREKEALFEHTLTMLLGPKPDRYYSPPWHNPDTCEHPQGEYNGR